MDFVGILIGLIAGAAFGAIIMHFKSKSEKGINPDEHNEFC